MQYRKDIQILRGVAVLLVVCFHLGLSGFASGFLGVDVFFVISGFLMAMLYSPDKKIDFFSKRAKRLLPAYFATIIATLLAATVLTTPNEFSQVSDQAGFAAVFASNIGFWLENSYFDKSAFRPLLHLWSLGVELQFYLIVPLLYWLFRKLKGSFSVVLAGSALLCFVVVGLSPKTSFFWMPLRLWQFLIGYGIALYLLKGASPVENSKNWIGVAGLLAIFCIPLLRIDGQALGFLHGHPGLTSLSISLATAVVIAFGIPRRILAMRLATWLERLGDYSYSIYLAHFPIIVLFLYQPFKGTIIRPDGWLQTLILAAMIVAISALLYTLVEKSFRHRQRIHSVGLIAVAAIFVLLPVGQKIQTAIFPKKEMLVYEAWMDRAPYRCGKLARITDPKAISCNLTPEITSPSRRVMLVGNSHADAIKEVFTSLAKANGMGVRFLIENSPLMKGGTSPAGLITEAKKWKTDAIVLHYASKTLESRKLEELATLATREGIEVSLVMPVPVWPEVVPAMILKNQKEGTALPIQLPNDYHRENLELEKTVALLNKVRAYDVATAYCTPVCQVIAPSGKPLYFDSNHLTLTGSEVMRPVLQRVLEDLRAKADNDQRSPAG